MPLVKIGIKERVKHFSLNPLQWYIENILVNFFKDFKHLAYELPERYLGSDLRSF